jgi:hypothetical protein
VLGALSILTKISRSEHPPVLADRETRHKLDSHLDLDLTPESHGCFDHHRIFSQPEHFDPPDEIGPRRMFMWVIGIGGSIRTSDCEFNRTATVKDLLEGSLPLIGS